jgi:hypothetical protein
MLIGTLIPVTRRPSAILDNRPYFRRWAGRTSVRRHGSLTGSLTWWTTEACRRRWRWRRTATSMRAVVRVRDTVRLGWLLWLVQRCLRLSMSRLGRQLRWLSMIWTWSDVMCLRRGRHATTHRSSTWRWMTNRALRARPIGRRPRGLWVRPWLLLSRTCWSLMGMLGRRTDGITLFVWVQLLRWKARIADLS